MSQASLPLNAAPNNLRNLIRTCRCSFFSTIAGANQYNFPTVQHLVPGVLMLNETVFKKFEILLLELSKA